MCVILFTKINGKTILAKNRDRTYKPNIELIHEIVNGIELAYISDKKTGWVEGMNENGCGIVNSTLNMNESKHVKKMKKTVLKTKKNKIFNALCQEKNDKIFYNLIKQKNGTNNNDILEGHTLVTINNQIFHIENNVYNDFVIKKVNKPVVYTNHGINLKSEGFTQGKKGLSSFLRRKLVETELKCNKDVDLYDDFVENVMNVNYTNVDPRFHSYRDKKLTLKNNNINKNQVFINTTGQLILNMTDKEFVYYTDVNNSENINYINKLPSNYVPKIRVIIKETEKRVQVKKKAFTRKYLNNLYNKFDYNPLKDKHNKTQKHHKHLAKKI
jgi:hypothetical protein